MLQKIFYWASIAPSGIYVLIVGRLDVDGQSFASIGLHYTDAASDWLLIKRHCIGTKGLPGVLLQDLSDNISCRCDFSINRKEDATCHLKSKRASGKLKNQPRLVLRLGSENF
jgi:hypothetical protein